MTPVPLPTTYYLAPQDVWLASASDPWPLVIFLAVAALFYALGLLRS